jgi:hypothetical protein
MVVWSWSFTVQMSRQTPGYRPIGNRMNRDEGFVDDPEQGKRLVMRTRPNPIPAISAPVLPT